MKRISSIVAALVAIAVTASIADASRDPLALGSARVSLREPAVAPARFHALEPAPPGAPPLLLCTPEGFGIVGQDFADAEHSIVEALRRAEPGSTILLEPGDYPAFTLGLGSRAWNNSDSLGGKRDLPVVIEGGGRARVVGKDSDAIGIDQRKRVQFITFRGITIATGRRSGVMFYKRQDGRNHRGFIFEDCEILGGYDHARGRGRFSKWGIWAHRLEEFRFVGTLEPARVGGLRDEHAFYIQNPQGDVLIENVIGNGLGRTFVQLTCRRKDGPPGKGKFTVRNCKVSNIGLAPGDLYRGGSAFTVAGRHLGEILFEGNQFRGGFDERFSRLKPAGSVHGTGAFVAYQGGQPERNGTLVLKDNDFRMAYGCGDRALVAISGCEVVRLEGENRFESGQFHPALALEPLDDQGKPTGQPNLKVEIASSTKFEGSVTRRNVELTPEQLEALLVPEDSAP